MDNSLANEKVTDLKEFCVIEQFNIPLLFRYEAIDLLCRNAQKAYIRGIIWHCYKDILVLELADVPKTERPLRCEVTFMFEDIRRLKPEYADAVKAAAGGIFEAVRREVCKSSDNLVQTFIDTEETDCNSRVHIKITEMEYEGENK